MRRCFTLALAAALAAGCADGTTPTGVSAARGGASEAGTGALGVSVVGFHPYPDSVFTAVRGALVVVSFVDTIPSDTTSFPPESLMIVGLGIGPVVGRPALLDSIPVDTLPPDTIPTDTIPTDTIPTDTIPPDTNPPPPPPPPGCGRTGVVVARGRTDAQGLLRVTRLPPGKYDLKIVPQERSGLGGSFYCGAIVFSDRVTPVSVTLFRAPPDSTGR